MVLGSWGHLSQLGRALISYSLDSLDSWLQYGPDMWCDKMSRWRGDSIAFRSFMSQKSRVKDKSTYTSKYRWRLTKKTRRAKAHRMHPSSFLVMSWGKKGDVHCSIVATPSMVANMFGIVEMHSATTTPIKMTECSGGGAPLTFISIGHY